TVIGALDWSAPFFVRLLRRTIFPNIRRDAKCCAPAVCYLIAFREAATKSTPKLYLPPKSV
ncbi:MAG: hypothetical protein AAFQ68_22860, partial [Bacteroidota bacterium]